MCKFNSQKGASRIVLGVILSTIIIGVGCGQNNHVTGGDSKPVDFDTLAQAATPIPTKLIEGPAGPAGLNGVNGINGKDGINGINGINGIDGKDGINGKDGAQGPRGEKGEKGDKGDTGAIGLTGPQGPRGEKGETGATGLTGATGPQGAAGEKGADGKNGVDGVNGKDGINGKDGHDGINGRDGKDGLNGKDGINGKDAVITPITIAKPRDGKDGRNGIDGKSSCIVTDIKTIPASPYTLAQIRSMIANDVSASLPYFLSNKKKTPMELFSIRHSNTKDRYIENAEVIFAIPFQLPNKEFIIADGKDFVLSAKLRLDIVKKKAEASVLFNDTEVVCSADNFMCSGSFFHDSEFAKLINHKYKVTNKVFSEELKLGIENSIPGAKSDKVFETSLELDIASVFSSSDKPMTQEELLEFLYSKVPANQADHKMVTPKLQFVVADDTRVERAEVVVEYAYDGCKLYGDSNNGK